VWIVNKTPKFVFIFASRVTLHQAVVSQSTLTSGARFSQPVGVFAVVGMCAIRCALMKQVDAWHKYSATKVEHSSLHASAILPSLSTQTGQCWVSSGPIADRLSRQRVHIFVRQLSWTKGINLVGTFAHMPLH
jgi:hypothetical protein